VAREMGHDVPIAVELGLLPNIACCDLQYAPASRPARRLRSAG
jgi:hypothetical protein